jgi:predicted amidohydrolase
VRAPLTIAAVQPPCTAGDLAANVRAHADAIRNARARVVVFPELSLTGYELDADPISPDDPALRPIVDACDETGSIAFVGAPIGDDGRASIAMLRVDADGVAVAYRKTFLGGDELRRFTPGDGATAQEVDGWRLGLGICKDTGAAEHVREVAALDVDVYLAGIVHHREELFVQEARALAIASATAAYVVFASFAGATGGGYVRTAGASAIWSPDGTALARAGVGVGEVARATLA